LFVILIAINNLIQGWHHYSKSGGAKLYTFRMCNGDLHFYKIPLSKMRFKAKRRLLWFQAINWIGLMNKASI